jgi:hypothetical protein
MRRENIRLHTLSENLHTTKMGPILQMDNQRRAAKQLAKKAAALVKRVAFAKTMYGQASKLALARFVSKHWKQVTAITTTTSTALWYWNQHAEAVGSYKDKV